MNARHGRRGLAVVLALTLLPLAALAQSENAERPTYAVGDEWALTDATYRLVRIDKGVYVFTAEGQREIRLTRDLGLAYVRRGADYLEIDPAPRVPWPLQVGKWGSLPVVVHWPGASSEAWLTWRVEGRESLVAGGRTLTAFRIRYSSNAQRPGGNLQRFGDVQRAVTFDVTLWYAPALQRIVKASSSKSVLTFEAAGSGTAVAQAPPAPAPAPSPPAAPAAPPPGPSKPAPAVATPPPAPLDISVRYPPDGARTTDEQTLVAAIASSSRGVASVTVSVNGTEVRRQADPGAPPSVEVQVPVPLREGNNTIIVTARENNGATRQEVRTVTRERGATAKAAPEPPAPPHDSWAVIIGVGRYESAGIPFLKYSVPDADSMYSVLTTSAGFKKQNVLLLTDRSEMKPTLRNMKYALGTWLARNARKDDTVIVYFAGHGAPEVDPRGLERDGLAKYLIPSDADPDDLFATALPMDDLQTIFGRIEAERVVMFLDACYSGAAEAGGRTFASKKTRAGAVDDLFLDRLTRSKGRVIVTAAKANEVSMELPELGHGIFTYFLAEGLRGAADQNRDGIVSLDELYAYLGEQVGRKSRAVGGNQHPMLKGEQEGGGMPLTKVRQR
jgi:caspase domain-containing protein/Big-like domain-containing protein